MTAPFPASQGWDGAGSPDGVEPPGDAVIRITGSRGFDPSRGVAPNAGGQASVAIQAWPFVPPAARALQEGERFVLDVPDQASFASAGKVG